MIVLNLEPYLYSEKAVSLWERNNFKYFEMSLMIFTSKMIDSEAADGTHWTALDLSCSKLVSEFSLDNLSEHTDIANMVEFELIFSLAYY
mgnify:CR=1 FL=1